jgi:Tfp pilus assembly protein PilX
VTKTLPMTEKFAACSVAPSASETHCYETPPHPFNTRPPQQGIALVTVLVLLLLSLTAVLGALRYSNLNEAMLGNTSDYNRTFAAAEALVRDAEIDIRGRLPPYTLQADGSRGTPCRPTAAGSLTTLAGFQGCRNKALPIPHFSHSTVVTWMTLKPSWQPIHPHIAVWLVSACR